MLRRRLILLCALVLCSCIQPPDLARSGPASPLRTTLTRPAAFKPDYRQSGPASVTVTNDKLMFGAVGALDYSIFQPAHRRSDVLVVVGHGFLRNKERMTGLARHIASWGLEVATLDFRHSRDRPKTNAIEMTSWRCDRGLLLGARSPIIGA